FNGFPGLRHKFYLYDAEENVYAPFYIWENAQYAQEFLLDNLFNGVSQKFGRPRVRSWQVVAFDYGELKEDPGYMRSAIDKVPSNESVGMQMEKEKARHDKVLASPGLYMHMVLLDPDRWEVGHFSFWGKAEQAPSCNAIGILKAQPDARGRCYLTFSETGAIAMMDRRTRISILLMSGCQALLNSSTAIMIPSAALVALTRLGPDKSLATLPVSAVVTGTALATLPASLIMRRIGRQQGFILGAGFGIFGAAICSYAVWIGSFWIFTFGALILGTYAAFGNYYRFAAVDIAGHQNRSRAVSYVLAGGLIAGFLGPQIASHSRELFLPYLYLGTYLAVILLGLLAIVLISFVRIPKMTVSMSDEPQRALRDIIRHP